MFSINTLVDRSKGKQFLTGYSFGQKLNTPIHGAIISFIGTVIDDSFGSELLTVQGAGVVTIPVSSNGQKIIEINPKQNIGINDYLYLKKAKNGLLGHLDTDPANMIVRIGRVHYVHRDKSQIVSIDVKIDETQLRSNAFRPQVAAPAAAKASGGVPIIGGVPAATPPSTSGAPTSTGGAALPGRSTEMIQRNFTDYRNRSAASSRRERSGRTGRGANKAPGAPRGRGRGRAAGRGATAAMIDDASEAEIAPPEEPTQPKDVAEEIVDDTSTAVAGENDPNAPGLLVQKRRRRKARLAD
ncbi:MAG: hypothetical protein CL678_00450 [Bdellovibrionaceae bacterium]|nr:hypothetical protein [Pseudobdellovibrionaceae bacterium]|tara:strand:+ start:3117 stop:4013 length:897 start_codon:yes stop_codon:yes gene_type:complete